MALWLWVHAHFCASAGVHLCLCAPVPVGPKVNSRCLLQSVPISSHFVFGDKENSPSRLAWLTSKHEQPACLCLSSVGVIGMRHHAQFIQWVLGIERRSSHLKTSISPARPSPQLRVQPFKGTITSQFYHINSLQMTCGGHHNKSTLNLSSLPLLLSFLSVHISKLEIMCINKRRRAVSGLSNRSRY